MEAIDDITEACELIIYVDLSMKGLNSLDEMKSKLREYLRDWKGLRREGLGSYVITVTLFQFRHHRYFCRVW